MIKKLFAIDKINLLNYSGGGGIFMHRFFIKAFGLLVISFTLYGCFAKENNNSQNIIISESLEPNYHSHIDELVLNGTHETNLNNITDFFFYEIMDGNRDLGFHRDEFEVIELFGKPIEIRIVPVNFNMQGGVVVEIHEYVYHDFIHHYYIFESGEIFYIGFIIENRLERLRTINIGDTFEELLSKFYDDFFTWEHDGFNTITFYTDPVMCSIQFVIRDGIIERISVNFFLA